eukprot:GHVP01000044.1.p1 GENE.GHVP01000044.1~~GHVP01000044.1.p1  ORF type:complete len:154 (+),score=31.85 GHVP01000044.1:38-463(+)
MDKEDAFYSPNSTPPDLPAIPENMKINEIPACLLPPTDDYPELKFSSIKAISRVRRYSTAPVNLPSLISSAPHSFGGKVGKKATPLQTEEFEVTKTTTTSGDQEIEEIRFEDDKVVAVNTAQCQFAWRLANLLSFGYCGKW